MHEKIVKMETNNSDITVSFGTNFRIKLLKKLNKKLI